MIKYPFKIIHNAEQFFPKSRKNTMIKKSLVSFLIFLMFPSIVQAQDNRPVVGVVEMRDLASTKKAEEFSAMIETAIISSGKFRVIERSQLARLVQEQQRAAGKVVTSNRSGNIGGFEGVDYLIYGTITGISAVEKQDVGAQLLSGLLSNNNSNAQAGCKATTVRLEADIRITDTATGDVRYASSISEIQQSATVCGGGAQIDSNALLRSAADKIATGLTTAIYPIQVAASQGDGSLILNYGQGAVSVGDYLAIYGPSTEIPDPSGSGRMIKIDGSQMGLIQISDVQANFSRAKIVGTPTGAIDVGAIARPATDEIISQYGVKSKRKRRK